MVIKNFEQTMDIQCIEYQNGLGKFEISIDLEGLSMIESEIKIQEAVNDVGNLITQKRLEEFDTDGSPIKMGEIKFTSKGPVQCQYETPYGQVDIDRHVYQTNQGGKTYCPLEDNARIVKKTCTPKLAKMVANKYANAVSSEVVKDMQENHSRKLVRSFVQNVSEFVGAIADAKEETWEYDLPKIDDPVTTIGISVDGENVLILKDGYRESMTGSISLYNKAGERIHSMYIAVEPEYGKAKFFKRMEVAIAKIKNQFPSALYLGISDGAHDLWEFLKKHTSEQILDFYHATEYLSGASQAMFPTNKKKRKQWLDDACSSLKHNHGYATSVITEMETKNQDKIKKPLKEKLEAAITYFKNNKSRMSYAKNTQDNLPIGSGVIEAACKTIVKSRLCQSGMKWKNKSVKIVLSLRAMIKTKGKWEDFWQKIDQYGVPNIS